MDASSPALSSSSAGTERDIVARLLGRQPSGHFEVVVRNAQGDPVVIRNAPFLDDGTPMPTMFWLCDPELTRAVSRLEALGGVRRAEAEVPSDSIEAAHRLHERLRSASIPDGHRGPRPSGGVAGTGTGVKCLHAHFAWYLAGGDDPVGRWVHEQLEA